MAYGKKNHVNLNPLAYNIMLLGESKIGKTTLIKEVCEKLAGVDGYLFIECGQERGADAIEGINHINCPTWEMDEYDEITNSHGFADVCEDIIENKTSEYGIHTTNLLLLQKHKLFLFGIRIVENRGILKSVPKVLMLRGVVLVKAKRKLWSLCLI